MRLRLAIGLVALAACTGTNTSADLAETLTNARPGDVIEVEAGIYQGPIVIDRPLSLRALGQVMIEAPNGEIGLEIRETSDVALSGVMIVGGDVGIRVWRSDGIKLTDIEVQGAVRHGILAENSNVSITNCEVSGLTGPYPRGIEIKNSELHEDSTVESCTVFGPVHEGIVSRLSHVRFHENLVIGATESGIAVTEMSAGAITSSAVESGSGVGILCGDMSMCTIVDNHVHGLQPGDDRISTAGHGVVVQYHSMATVEGLTTSDLAGESLVTSLGGIIRDP